MRHRLLATVAACVTVVAAIAVYRAVCQVALVLRVHGQLVVLCADGREAVVLVLRLRCREEVNDEALEENVSICILCVEIDHRQKHTPRVEDVDQRNDPFENGGMIVSCLVPQHGESDSQSKFDEDKRKLNPETRAEDTVFTPFDAQSLVLGADEDCGDDVAGTATIVSYSPGY